MKTPLAALAVALLLSGCMADDDGKGTSAGGASGSSTGSGSKEVELRDNLFDPKTLAVAAGEAVRFDNEGANKHTVTIHWVGDPADVTKLNQTLDVDGSVSHTFATAGTYHVWCRFHGSMTAGMAMVVTAT